MQKILCHACCGVCALYPLQKLKKLNFDPIIYFYNPNIYPLAEYERRLAELVRYCRGNNIRLEIEQDNQSVWDRVVEGLENEPEKGKRCEKCFMLRLDKTAQYAVENGIKIITTTLTVSPHKNSKVIFQVLEDICKKYDLEYLHCDFKKENGFLITNQLAQAENFYRQTYCGCKYSMRQQS